MGQAEVSAFENQQQIDVEVLNFVSDEDDEDEAACARAGWTWKLLSELSGFDKEAQKSRSPACGGVKEQK